MNLKAGEKGTDIVSEKLLEELEHLRQENAELRLQLGEKATNAYSNPTIDSAQLPLISTTLPEVTNLSSIEAKIALFRALFKGREADPIHRPYLKESSP